MKVKLSPSMMCADLLRLKETLHTFEEEKIEYLHMDIMDGQFVPNYMLGTDFVAGVRKISHIPVDLHLMIEEPEKKLDWFAPVENDLVSVHVESTRHLQKVLGTVRQRGARPVAAINPGTPLCMLEEVTDDIDGVLVMTVNPGFSGQRLVPGALDKIRRLRGYLDDRGREDVFIEVDGNVSIENAVRMRDAGAEIFVAGTSCLFTGEDLAGNIRAFRKAVR